MGPSTSPANLSIRPQYNESDTKTVYGPQKRYYHSCNAFAHWQPVLNVSIAHSCNHLPTHPLYNAPAPAQPELSAICIGVKDSHLTSNQAPAEGSGIKEECPDGQKPLFPHGSIEAAHYLLFIVAVLHIVQAYMCFSCTQARVRGAQML